MKFNELIIKEIRKGYYLKNLCGRIYYDLINKMSLQNCKKKLYLEISSIRRRLRNDPAVNEEKKSGNSLWAKNKWDNCPLDGYKEEIKLLKVIITVG